MERRSRRLAAAAFVGRLLVEFLAIMAATAVVLYLLVRFSPNYAGSAGLLAGMRDLGRGMTMQDPLQPYPTWKLVLVAGCKSIILTLGALVFTVLVSIPLGVLAAFKWDNRWIRTLVHGYYVLSNVPVFVSVIIVIELLRACGASLTFTGWQEMSSGTRILAVIVPCALLGLGNGCGADVVRHMRTELDQVRGQRFILAGIANGFSVRWSYVKNSMVPGLGVIDRKTAFLLGGGIVVETAFSIAGLGESILLMLQQQFTSMEQFGRLCLVCLVYAAGVRLIDIVIRSLSMSVDYRLLNPEVQR